MRNLLRNYYFAIIGGGGYPGYGYTYNAVPEQGMTDSPYAVHANHMEVGLLQTCYKLTLYVAMCPDTPYFNTVFYSV
jgi:hypothetical protein